MLQISDELTVKLSLAPILSFSLRSLIKNRLHQAIGLTEPIQTQRPNLVQQLDRSQHFSDGKIIPLNPVKDPARIAYQSAIALKLANQWNIPAIKLAEQIAISCSSANLIQQAEGSLPLESIYQHLVFQVQPLGWIDIELTDPGIALWLQMLITEYAGFNWVESPFNQIDQFDQPVRQTSVGCKNDSNFFQNEINLFEIQYTHARCCTFLRLGVQAELIACNDSPNLLSSFPWRMVQLLRLQHPAEWRLIQQISVVLDRLSDLLIAHPDLLDRTGMEPTTEKAASVNLDYQQQEILKLAQTLSQQVQVCHATWRIWDDVRSDLAQTRLGLTLVIQIVLHMLLETALGVTAPIEL